MGFLAEELRDLFHHFRHARHAADQNHLVDIADGQAGILQRGLAGLDRCLDQIVDQAFQLGARHLHHKVQRLAGVAVHADEGLVDFGLLAGRQFDLGLFRRLFQALKRHLVQRQVNAVFLFELVGQVVHDAHVKVFTAQERIPVGGFHFEQAVVDFQDGDVEGTAAKVIDRDRLRFFLVQAIGKGRRRGLVDDAQHFEAGDLAGVLGGLTLGVVEIGRHRDHGLGDGFTQIAFGGFLHFLQDEGRDLRRRIFLAAHFDPSVAIAAVHQGVGQVLLVFCDMHVIHAAPDQALHGEDGVRGVRDRLAFGRLADEAFGFGETDDGRGGAGPFRVLDHAGLCAVHDRNAGVRGPEVNPDDFGHSKLPLLSAMLWGAEPLWPLLPDPNEIRSGRPPHPGFGGYISGGPVGCKRYGLLKMTEDGMNSQVYMDRPVPTLHLRGFDIHAGLIPAAEQPDWVDDIRAVVAAAPLISPVTPGGRPMSVRMTAAGRLGWVTDRAGYRYAPQHPGGGDWPPIPARVLALWHRVTGLARAPDCCLINFYGQGARMGLHQDKDEGDFSFPVLSVSLGDDALFRMGGADRPGPTQSLWLTSGDVVVMGGEARLAWHGIDRVRHGSSALLPKGGRINLTLRVVAG